MKVALWIATEPRKSKREGMKKERKEGKQEGRIQGTIIRFPVDCNLPAKKRHVKGLSKGLAKYKRPLKGL